MPLPGSRKMIAVVSERLQHPVELFLSTTLFAWWQTIAFYNSTRANSGEPRAAVDKIEYGETRKRGRHMLKERHKPALINQRITLETQTVIHVVASTKIIASRL